MPTRSEEIAWAAGLFEGEGTITLSNERLCVRLVNTDEEIIQRFADVMPVGTLYGPYPPYMSSGHRRKPLWAWIAMEEAGLDALAFMWEWLGSRRRQRATELSGIPFPVFFRAARELLAQPGEPPAPPPPAAAA